MKFKIAAMSINEQIQLSKLKINVMVNQRIKTLDTNIDIAIVCIYYETEAQFTKQTKQTKKNRFEGIKINFKKDLTIDSKDFGYMGFWGKTLQKMTFDTDKSIYHYKNLKPIIWILFFNPAIVILYFLFAILFLVMSLIEN